MEDKLKIKDHVCDVVHVAELVQLLTEGDFSDAHFEASNVDRIEIAANMYKHMVMDGCSACNERLSHYLEQISAPNSRFNDRLWKANTTYLEKLVQKSASE